MAFVALVVRLYRLGEPVLRWDEGWSLAHASLSWPQLWRVATEEWHPPLYVALLKLWLVLGKSATRIRLLSVLAGVAAVPLAAMLAGAWSRRPRVATLTAGLVAVWPLLVYYGQVTRMYALTVLPVLAAAWFALRGEEGDAPLWVDAGLALSAVLALYTLYYTVWPLAGIWLYAGLMRPRRIGRLAGAGGVVSLGYLPWLLVARTTLQSRIGSGGAAADALRGTIAFLKPTIGGLTFVYGGGWRSAAVLGAVLLAGLALGLRGRAEARRLLLPLLTVGLSVIGISYGAQASRWFAVRHLVPACAFLLLALAWALDRLVARWRPLLVLAVVALAVAYWPAATQTVYAKMLEVVDPFDPSADHRYLVSHANATDLVYFNVLARAGWYENLRRSGDPSWSYAMRWDPIIEPMGRIAERITADSARYDRLWFVLFKGAYGPNEELKRWLDANLYPAGGAWQEDVLFLAYVSPGADWTKAERDDRFVNGVRLKWVRWTPAASTGGACAVELAWESDSPIAQSYKVFVHAVDDAGRLVAQHDGEPASGTRPVPSWAVGEMILDRHGLFLPTGGQGQRLRLLVGLYDPNTGQRLSLVDGTDAIAADELTVTWLASR
jgi:hypothetical protein